jgi:hypothetical protein
MSGLPLFSRSSSNRSDGKMVAHPAGWLFLLANRQGGVLQQENSADPSLAVTGDPKTFLVAADEKCRDRLIDDAGIERLKLSDEGRQDAGALVLPLQAPLGANDLGLSAARRSSGFYRWRRTARGLPRTNLLGLRRNLSHPVADKGIEHFAVSCNSGFNLFPDALFLVCSIESDLGHGGLLAGLTVMMCRRRHRIARWIGVASHRREIGIPKRNGVAANLGRPLCRGYE